MAECTSTTTGSLAAAATCSTSAVCAAVSEMLSASEPSWMNGLPSGFLREVPIAITTVPDDLATETARPILD